MRLLILSFFCLTAALILPAHATEDNSGFGAPFTNDTVAALNDQTGDMDDEAAMLAAAAAFSDIAPAAGGLTDTDEILPGEENLGAADFAPLSDSLTDKYIGP